MHAQSSRKHWLIGFLVFLLVISTARLISPLFCFPFTQLGSIVAARLGIDEKAWGFRYSDYPFLTPNGALVYSIPTAIILALITVWICKRIAVQHAADKISDENKEG